MLGIVIHVFDIVNTVNWGDFGPLFYCFKSRVLIIILIMFIVNVAIQIKKTNHTK